MRWPLRARGPGKFMRVMPLIPGSSHFSLRIGTLLLCALGVLDCLAAPALEGKDWLLIKHEPTDPLNTALWEGDPRQLLSALPQSVGVLVFQPETAASAPPAPGPWSEAQRIRASELPPAIRHTLDTFGYDLREVAVSPPVVPDFRAVGDSGIGKVLAPGTSVAFALAYWGNDACRQQAPQYDVAGSAVLIRRGGCPFVEKVQAAKRAGAQAVLIVNNLQPINRVAGPCNDCKDMVLAAIPQVAGEALIAATSSPTAQAQPITIELRGARAMASALRISRQGSVQEAGYIPYPFNHLLDQPLDPFYQLALEAVDLDYQSRQTAMLRHQTVAEGHKSIPVFDGVLAKDPDWTGQRIGTLVAVPEDFLSASQLWWDLTLECEGVLKSQCPPWDYIANMYLCQDAQAARCEDEVGRWITPYWSGGRWVAETTALLGRMRRAAQTAARDAQGRALLRFEFHSIQPYRVRAALRYAPAIAQSEVPLDALRLPFAGGDMHDGRFAQRQGTATLRIPAGVHTAHFAALLSGHGFADDDKCAEFCNTVHHLEIEGAGSHQWGQAQAGSATGCLEQVGSGVVPNQGGTWVYGRNGWCPGNAVPLTVVDLSADVAALREALGHAQDAAPEIMITLRYRATVNGKDHAPGLSADGRASDARLDVSSYLVFYGKP